MKLFKIFEKLRYCKKKVTDSCFSQIGTYAVYVEKLLRFFWCECIYACVCMHEYAYAEMSHNDWWWHGDEMNALVVE